MPLVKHFCAKKFQLTTVLLLHVLDNAPAHPSTEKLVSADGKVTALFLPPNTTSILQPIAAVNVVLKPMRTNSQQLWPMESLLSSVVSCIQTLLTNCTLYNKHALPQPLDPFQSSALKRISKYMSPLLALSPCTPQRSVAQSLFVHSIGFNLVQKHSKNLMLAVMVFKTMPLHLWQIRCL